jgi:hypothetical protein
MLLLYLSDFLSHRRIVISNVNIDSVTFVYMRHTTNCSVSYHQPWQKAKKVALVSCIAVVVTRASHGRAWSSPVIHQMGVWPRFF